MPREGWHPADARVLQAGALRSGEQWFSLNRPAEEDTSPVLEPETVDGLFRGLDYRRVSDQIGSPKPLASEIWRALLVIMSLALLVEAWLCLPDRPRRKADLLEFGR